MKVPEADSENGCPWPLYADMTDTSLFQVAFASGNRMQLRDKWTGTRVEEQTAWNVFLEQVTTLGIATDSELLLREVNRRFDEWDALRDSWIAESEAAAAKRKAEAEEAKKRYLKTCRPSEFLRLAVFPALAPALAAIERQRPADPLAFLAVYLLKNKVEVAQTSAN